MTTAVDHPPVAIVGLSALFPDSVDSDRFWHNILDGSDLIGDVPPSHWLADDYYDPEPGDADKTYTKRGGFLPDIDFDPVEFGIPPKNIPSTDTTQLLALICAKRVLADAFGDQFGDMDKSKMSIVLGVTAGQELLIQAAARLQRPQWLASLREHGIPEDEAQQICDRIAGKYTPWQENTFPGLLGNVVAGRIANRFDLGGTNCITDAACASSLSAMSMGLNELYLGHSDVVITGGVDCFNDIFMYMCFTKTPALSKAGDCRPFDASADGTLLGEGLGMFALKRLDDAEADDDEIYAVIRGLGSSSDGRSLSVYAPLAEGQANALRRAQQRGGVDPQTVELVEAHGTATKAGDVAEFDGLCRAFSDDSNGNSEADGGHRSDNSPWCALGSIKSQIGHTKAAAGAASLFKAVMGLHHRTLPPTVKVDEPNPKLDVDQSPFYVNTESRPWIRGSDHPRRAGVSSFGFGGSNFHVVIEEYDGPAPTPSRKRVLSTELFAYGAPTAATLADNIQSVLSQLDDRPEHPGQRHQLLAFLAFDSQQAFDADTDHRLTLTASNLDELHDQLHDARRRLDDDTGEFETPSGMFYRAESRAGGDVALLFPGQGSQYVGMGGELAMHFDIARSVWDRAADLDFQLHERVFPPPAFDDDSRQAQQQALTATEWAQPAIGCDSAARLALLDKLGVAFDAVAGHSFGEITALFAAGAYDEDTMLEIARTRGELMADAASSTDGAMVAVRADADAVRDIIDDCGADVVVANDNSPGQVVVSGPTEQIEIAEEAFERDYVACMRLPVDTAFHSDVVADATDPFAEFLDEVELDSLDIDVYANATADIYADDPDDVRSTLTTQIESPVRFVEMIRQMHDDGVATFIEVGPHDTLSGLASRCLDADAVGDLEGVEDVEIVALDHRDSDDISATFSAVAKLAALGVELDYRALWEGYAEPDDPTAVESSSFSVKINGANVGRPYPPEGGADNVPEPNPPSTHHKSPRTSAAPATDATASSLPTTNQESPMTDHNDAPDGPPTTNGQHQGYARPADSDRSSPSTSSPQHTSPNAPEPPQPPRNEASATAFSEYQRALTESHQEYLRVMEQSIAQAQRSYMQAMENSFRQWCDGDTPAPRPDSQPAARDSRTPNRNAQPPKRSAHTPPRNPQTPTRSPEPATGGPGDQTPNHRPATPDRAAGPRASQSVTGDAGSETGAPRPETQTPDPTEETPPSNTPEASPETRDITSVFLDVVADKTGYPTDMLDDSMALEADLGIDSIKRVEILSAVQQQVPSLPEIDPNEMAPLKTVGEIVDYLENSGSTEPQGSNQPPPHAAAETPDAQPESSEAGDITSVFLDVVADKTGYPTDMLDDSMALEADLGIDSIKRVEILSAVQKQVPSLPEIDPNEMAPLKTVGEIVDYLEEFNGGSGSSATADDEEQRLGKPEAATGPARFVPGPVAAPSAGINQLTPSPITILDGDSDVGPALAKELARRGYTATLADAGDASGAAQIVDVRALGSMETVDDALQRQKEAFRALRSARRSDAGNLETCAVVFDTGGAFGFPVDDATAVDDRRVWSGGLAALAKTAALEWPETAVKAIDIATDDLEPREIAERIADELTAGGPEIEVGYSSDGTRRTISSRLVELDESATLALDAEDVVVASGGARGVTARCLIELAERHQPSIALLGRTALDDEPNYVGNAKSEAEIKRVIIERTVKQTGDMPDPGEVNDRARDIAKTREIRETIDAIEAAGSDVAYHACDVCNRDALTEALDSIRAQFGAPTALVHAAGVLADKAIVDKTDEQFDFVFDTKIDGLRALLETTDGDPLEHLILFSSVAARTGNTGQVDYAMANETFNKVARTIADRRDLRAHSINWGPWDGGMVDDALRKHFESQGVELIDLDAGARAFCREISATDTEVVIGAGLPDATESTAVQVSFDAISTPELKGHVVGDTPVVPAAVVADIFGGLATSLRPDANGCRLRNIDVKKGIQLADFDDPTRSARFTVTAESLRDDDAKLQLKSPDGTIHYSATAELRSHPPSADALEVAEQLDDAPWDIEEIYGDLLFHDEPFDVMESVAGFGDDGVARATVAPTTAAIALDAALQLALLMGIAIDGRSNLPTSIKEFVDFGIDDVDGPLELAAALRETTDHNTVTDIDIRDARGRLVAAIRGLHMFFHGDALLQDAK